MKYTHLLFVICAGLASHIKANEPIEASLPQDLSEYDKGALILEIQNISLDQIEWKEIFTGLAFLAQQLNEQIRSIPGIEGKVELRLFKKSDSTDVIDSIQS